MKAIALSLVFGAASGVAFAQVAIDSMAHVRDCSTMERAERAECLDRPSGEFRTSDRVSRGVDNWIISETTSPINYEPIVTATAFSRGGALMQLAIYCRGRRTELVVSGPAVSRIGVDYTISFSVNDGPPVRVAAGSPLFGSGVAFTGDVVRLLQSLPENGDITVRTESRKGAAQEGLFSLGGLRTVRAKLAAACRWSNALAAPRN